MRVNHSRPNISLCPNDSCTGLFQCLTFGGNSAFRFWYSWRGAICVSIVQTLTVQFELTAIIVREFKNLQIMSIHPANCIFELV